MAKMRKRKKYRSSVFSKSSWNKRTSCRQNLRKGRIKGNYKRRAKAQRRNNDFINAQKSGVVYGNGETINTILLVIIIGTILCPICLWGFNVTLTIYLWIFDILSFIF